MTGGNGPFSTILFDMGGVLIRYQNIEMFLRTYRTASENQVFGQAIKRYEEGMVSVPELKDIVEDVLGEDPAVWTAVGRLRHLGFRLGLLTNNGFLDTERTRSSIINDTSMFDIVVESCRIGIRKPDPRFFLETLKVGDLRADECVFLDDVEKNCMGAKAVGMTAIHVRNFDSRLAIAELEELLQLRGQLLDETLPSN